MVATQPEKRFAHIPYFFILKPSNQDFLFPPKGSENKYVLLKEKLQYVPSRMTRKSAVLYFSMCHHDKSRACHSTDGTLQSSRLEWSQRSICMTQDTRRTRGGFDIHPRLSWPGSSGSGLYRDRGWLKGGKMGELFTLKPSDKPDFFFF